MANKSNDCDNLNLDNKVYHEFDKIFQMQKDLQEKTYGFDFKAMNLKELSDFFLFNKHALEDELSETMDALGGIHDGVGSAVWKKWKSNHVHITYMYISDLSERDRKELLMEIVDQFHFFMNQAVACGFTGSDIANAYKAKRAENVRRQQQNY